MALAIKAIPTLYGEEASRFQKLQTKQSANMIMRVCHKSMAHPLLCYLLHNPRSIVAYSKKGIILYRLQILLFPIFSIINRQEVHKRA